VEESKDKVNERKEHLDAWLQKYNYKLNPIEPAANEVSVTKEEGREKITIKLDMMTRRIDTPDEEGQNESEEREVPEEEGEGEGSEGSEDSYFEEKQFEVWVEKEGKVLVVQVEISTDGLVPWTVGIYKNPQQATEGKSEASFDIRKLDDEGYEKWRLFLNGYGIDDEFVLVSDILCELYDDKAYGHWLQQTKEFLLK